MRLASLSGAAFRIGSLALVAGLSGLTLLYDLPVNPIVLSGPRWIEQGVGRFVSKDLALFAPNPVTSDYALLVRPIRSGTAGSAAGDAPWYDISSPLWERYRGDRLSPYGRLFRLQVYSIQDCLADRRNVALWRDAADAREPGAPEVYAAYSDEVRSRAVLTLQRIASAFANQVFTDRAYDRVAMQICITAGVPWSKRWLSPARSAKYVDLGVFPVDRSVAPANFYEAKDFVRRAH